MRKYEEGQQGVLGLTTEGQVGDELAIFFEMEEIYETAIDKANKISKKGKTSGKRKGKMDGEDKGGTRSDAQPGNPTQDGGRQYKATQPKSMVNKPLEPNAQEPPAKKARQEQLNPAGPSTTPADDEAVSEEVLKRYFKKRPMTTTDLLRKFMIEKTCTQDGKLVQLLAMLKKNNPYKHKVKGVTYISLKDQEKSTKDGPEQDAPLRDELEGARSKDKTHSCRPIRDKTKVTPSPMIRKGGQQPTPRIKETEETREP